MAKIGKTDARQATPTVNPGARMSPSGTAVHCFTFAASAIVGIRASIAQKHKSGLRRLCFEAERCGAVDVVARPGIEPGTPAL